MSSSRFCTMGVMNSTIGTKHPEVRMYDSLYCSLSSALKWQIAALLATKEKKIHFMDVQMQAGGDECGVFSIAFATATHLASSSYIRGPCDATSSVALRGGTLQCSLSTEVDVMKTELNQRRPLLYSAHAECLSFLELKWSNAHVVENGFISIFVSMWIRKFELPKCHGIVSLVTTCTAAVTVQVHLVSTSIVMYTFASFYLPCMFHCRTCLFFSIVKHHYSYWNFCWVGIIGCSENCSPGWVFVVKSEPGEGGTFSLGGPLLTRANFAWQVPNVLRVTRKYAKVLQ